MLDAKNFSINKHIRLCIMWIWKSSRAVHSLNSHWCFESEDWCTWAISKREERRNICIRSDRTSTCRANFALRNASVTFTRSDFRYVAKFRVDSARLRYSVSRSFAITQSCRSMLAARRWTQRSETCLHSRIRETVAQLLTYPFFPHFSFFFREFNTCFTASHRRGHAVFPCRWSKDLIKQIFIPFVRESFPRETWRRRTARARGPDNVFKERNNRTVIRHT